MTTNLEKDVDSSRVFEVRPVSYAMYLHEGLTGMMWIPVRLYSGDYPWESSPPYLKGMQPLEADDVLDSANLGIEVTALAARNLDAEEGVEAVSIVVTNMDSEPHNVKLCIDGVASKAIRTAETTWVDWHAEVIADPVASLGYVRARLEPNGGRYRPDPDDVDTLFDDHVESGTISFELDEDSAVALLNLSGYEILRIDVEFVGVTPSRIGGEGGKAQDEGPARSLPKAAFVDAPKER